MVVRQVPAHYYYYYYYSHVPEHHDHLHAFHTQSFKNKKQIIHNHDQEIIEPFTIKQVKSALGKLSNKKAPGPDRIPNELLKIMKDEEDFINIYTKLLNSCLILKKVPKSWKQSWIFLVYKSKDPTDPMNYRPIALLNTSNKVFSMLMVDRFNTFLESNKIFSDLQGGFRRNRTTFTKIWTLVQTIENALLNKKPLHVCYVDVKKAYDHVEHWGIKKVLTEYGFSQGVISLIMSICEDNTTKVITPHGLTSKINVTRGVRQGCPLSPTLFILFLDPLMLWLQESQLGYKINNTPLPGGAFCDDIVLTANSNQELQQLFDITQEFFTYFGLEISAVGSDKTIYTSNREKEEGTKLYIINPKTKAKETIPWLPKNESYKYLGLHINLCLDWTAQIKISNTNYMRHLAYLRRRCFTPSQTAEILNLVVFPAITYRMCIIKYPDEYLKKWDELARNLMGFKLRQFQFLDVNIGTCHCIMQVTMFFNSKIYK